MLLAQGNPIVTMLLLPDKDLQTLPSIFYGPRDDDMLQLNLGSFRLSCNPAPLWGSDWFSSFLFHWLESCCCLVAMSGATLHGPMYHSTPDLLILNRLPESAQTHAHCVSDPMGIGKTREIKVAPISFSVFCF